MNDAFDVLLGRSESPPEFFGRQPSVILGRLRILLRFEQSFERLLLRGVGGEHQHHAIHTRFGGSATPRRTQRAPPDARLPRTRYGNAVINDARDALGGTDSAEIRSCAG